MANKTLKYVGGFDEVTIYCPTSGDMITCARGESVTVLGVTAAGLSSEDWQEVKKKTPAKAAKGDA